MTLKSIIKTISNDKILSILILFLFILIGTIMYYNLNEQLLNNSRALEHFEYDNDDCDNVRELLNNPDEFETYEMKDVNGLTYEYLIINIPVKEGQIINYMKTQIKIYINELNKKFKFDNMEVLLLKSGNMNVASIKEIILTYMSCEDNTILNESIDEYKGDINDALTNYNISATSANNLDSTIIPIYKTNEYTYITDIYKIILKIIFKNKMNNTIKNLTNNISKYKNNPVSWRWWRVRNSANVLYKIFITLEFISDDANFDSKINSNLLNHTINKDGTPIRQMGNNNVDSRTKVLDLSANFNNDEDSLLYNYIQNSDTIFKEFITNYGFMEDLKYIYETNDLGYFHIYNHSYSIVQRYTSDDFEKCKQTIEWENSLCTACEGQVTCGGWGGFCNTCPSNAYENRTGGGNFKCGDEICEYKADLDFFEEEGCIATANTDSGVCVGTDGWKVTDANCKVEYPYVSNKDACNADLQCEWQE